MVAIRRDSAVVSVNCMTYMPRAPIRISAMALANEMTGVGIGVTAGTGTSAVDCAASVPLPGGEARALMRVSFRCSAERESGGARGFGVGGAPARASGGRRVTGQARSAGDGVLENARSPVLRGQSVAEREQRIREPAGQILRMPFDVGHRPGQFDGQPTLGGGVPE